MRLFWCCLQAAVCFVQDLGSLCGRLHRFTLRAQDVAAQKNRRPDQLPSALSLPSSPLHFSLIFEAAASGQWPGGSCFRGGTPSISHFQNVDANCAATKQETKNYYTTFDHRKWRMPQNSSQRDRHRRADDEFLDEDTSSEDASEGEDELLQDDERECRPPKRGRQAQSTAPATAQEQAITAQSATPSTDPTKMVRLEQQEASRSMGRDNFPQKKRRLRITNQQTKHSPSARMS